jgi:hypothetical protein
MWVEHDVAILVTAIRWIRVIRVMVVKKCFDPVVISTHSSELTTGSVITRPKRYHRRHSGRAQGR